MLSMARLFSRYAIAQLFLLCCLLVQGCSRSNPLANLNVPGISVPAIYKADDVRLPEGASVLGIVVDGVARAYLVDALSMPVGHIVTGPNDPGIRELGRHVVNDQVGETSVSVTYCDKTSCGAVYTRPGSEAIPLNVAGWSGESLLLTLEGKKFAQDEGLPELTKLSFERTSWAQWKAKHPETSVYLGADSTEFVVNQKNRSTSSS